MIYEIWNYIRGTNIKSGCFEIEILGEPKKTEFCIERYLSVWINAVSALVQTDIMYRDDMKRFDGGSSWELSLRV